MGNCEMSLEGDNNFALCLLVSLEQKYDEAGMNRSCRSHSPSANPGSTLTVLSRATTRKRAKKKTRNTSRGASSPARTVLDQREVNWTIFEEVLLDHRHTARLHSVLLTTTAGLSTRDRNNMTDEVQNNYCLVLPRKSSLPPVLESYSIKLDVTGCYSAERNQK